MTSYVYLEISMVVIVEGVEIGCRCWNVGTSPPVGVRNIKTILNGRKQQLRDLMLWWPYILTQAKERRRRSAITHMSKSSLPSPERNGVEITSVRTKKTRYLWWIHVSQPSDALTRFSWLCLPVNLRGPVTPLSPVWDLIGTGPHSGPILSTRDHIFITHWTTQRLCGQFMGWNLRNRDNLLEDNRKSLKPRCSGWVSVQERRLSNLTLFPWPRV